MALSMTPNDFALAGFGGRQPIYRRRTRPSSSGEEEVIEGTALTYNCNIVGYTCFLSDGLLVVRYTDPDHNHDISIAAEQISTREDFERILKDADNTIRAYLSK